jgi:hypothetical protein
MKGFLPTINLFVLLAFIGIPASEAVSFPVSGNEIPGNPAMERNLVLPDLVMDELRREAGSMLNSADRLSGNSQAGLENAEEGLLGPPTHRHGGEAEECPPSKEYAAPSDPEDDLLKFVTQVRAAECVQDWPMLIYGAVTYSPFKIRLPFRFMGRIVRVH